jgi:uncharacterized membrane protein
MDAKRLAMVLGIAVLLPLFLGLFVDAVYEAPRYDDYCKNYNIYPVYKEPVVGINCPDPYTTNPQYKECIDNKGNVIPRYDSNNCQVFSSCDYCSRDYDTANQEYNRNIFLILAPLGFMIVVVGIYVVVEYMGAALMFAGLITLFYATVRYFSDMSKILRALVVLIELILIIWIGYKKIGSREPQSNDADEKNMRFNIHTKRNFNRGKINHHKNFSNNRNFKKVKKN